MTESLDAAKKEQNAEKLKQGDPEAFEALYRELAPRIRQFAAWYSRGLDVDDVVAEVFVNLFSNPSRVADLVSKGNLNAWCLRLSRNIILHQIRRAERKPTLDLHAVEMSTEQQGADFATSAMQERVAKALALLDDSAREIIILHYMQGMTYAEISKIVGLKETTLRAMLVRARSRLRALVEEPAETQTNEIG